MRRIAATLAVVGALLYSAGSAWADFDDGVEAYNRGDYATALQEFRPLAEQGDAKAQFNLSFMYDKDNSFPQNDAEAVNWHSKAAEQGFAIAKELEHLDYRVATSLASMAACPFRILMFDLTLSILRRLTYSITHEIEYETQHRPHYYHSCRQPSAAGAPR